MTIEALGNRLKLLLGDVHFWSDFDRVLESPEQLIAIGEHNLREYEKIEAMDEERQERIRHIIFNLLSSVLQKEALERYGNTDSGSVRQVLSGWCEETETRAYWDRFTQSAKHSLSGFDLTEEQRQGVIKLFDMLPVTMIETLEELTSPLRFLPRTEAQSIAMALADVMKEERDANGRQYN